ncbi:MAG TPA: hypothetical protein VFD74_01565 [Thermoleophilia bacterium]|nr:hypothetical protein [Thermoleophilia bacterium]
MTVEYLIVGAVLIVGGVVQRRMRRYLPPEQQAGGGVAGRWSGVLGYVAVGLGVVLLVAGVLGR